MLRCICGRRRSSTRCVSRVVSERLSSSSWNGGVTLGFSTSSSWQRISTLPLVRLALSVPPGRARTRPVTFRQYSLRTSSATAKVAARSGSQTTCTRPSRSRRSMKITPPWSRRRCAQPISVIVWPRSASLTRPQYVVLIAFTPDSSVLGRGRIRKDRASPVSGARGRFGRSRAAVGLSACRALSRSNFAAAAASARSRRARAARPRPSRSRTSALRRRSSPAGSPRRGAPSGRSPRSGSASSARRC